jgi:maleylacetate reductase
MYQGTYTVPATERVVFGRPAAQVVREEMDRLGFTRVFLMASSALVEATPLVSQIVAALEHRSVTVWSGIAAHTPREDVLAAAAAARAAQAEVIVAIGGGSVTDAAKGVQTFLAQNVTALEQIDALRKRPDEAMTAARPGLRAPTVRMIAIPTTLAGAEFTPYAGITNRQRGVKEVFTHPLQAPRIVVLDPQVALHTPDWLWLSTGVRALDHAVEDICSVDAQPFSEGTALQAIRLLARALPATRKDPQDLQSRLDAQMAMWLSSVGPQAGVNMGASHAIGHALGGTGNVPHGYTSCIMMPHVMRFNEAAVHDRHVLIAQALGDRNTAAADLVARLIDGLDVPRTLSEVHITTDAQLDAVAQAAMEDPWIATNPRPITQAAQVRELLEAARG